MEEFKKKIKLISRDLKYQGSIMSMYDDVVDVDGNNARVARGKGQCVA